jgi:hypothetical protein
VAAGHVAAGSARAAGGGDLSSSGQHLNAAQSVFGEQATSVSCGDSTSDRRHARADRAPARLARRYLWNDEAGGLLTKVEAVVLRERIETVIGAVEGKPATWA